MKRGFLLAGLAVAAAAVIWRSLETQRAQRDLWTEVTDPLP
jgi:hypothetical protein